jgi:hypothetical protein
MIIKTELKRFVELKRKDFTLGDVVDHFMLLSSTFGNANKRFDNVEIRSKKNAVVSVKKTMRNVEMIETIELNYKRIDEKIENDKRKRRALRKATISLFRIRQKTIDDELIRCIKEHEDLNKTA